MILLKTCHFGLAAAFAESDFVPSNSVVIFIMENKTVDKSSPTLLQ
jgi:hypothetical protein